MAGKTLEQRINDTEERIRQLQAQKQLMSQQVRQQERRGRTRRLIQIGAIMARLGVDTVEKALSLQRAMERRREVEDWLGKVIQRASGTDQGLETREDV